MSDQITAEERRLIDEAIARGAVQVIPQGACAQADRFVYDPVEGKLVTQATLDGTYERKAFRFGRRRTSPRVSARRQRVRELNDQGLTRKQIAEAIGCGVHTVNEDMMHMNLRSVHSQKRKEA